MKHLFVSAASDGVDSEPNGKHPENQQQNNLEE